MCSSQKSGKDLIELARQRIAIDQEEQAERLGGEYHRTINRFAVNGVVASSMFVGTIADVCASAVAIRAQMTWQTLYRFVSTGGLSYSDTLAGQLKTDFRELLGNHEDICAYYHDAERVSGFAGRVDKIGAVIEAQAQRSVAKIEGEIDLLVASLRSGTSSSAAGSTVVNVYSPVGTIQTGDGATAHVTQHIDSEIRAQIEKVVEDVRTVLSALPELENANLNEISEVTEEVLVEAKAEKPNVTKLRALLTTVAQGVQSTAAARPAYKAARGVLSYFGVTLP